MLICFCSAKFLLQGVNIVSFSNDHNIVSSLIGLGAKSQILSSVAPPERKTWLLFAVRDMSWSLINPCFTKFSMVSFL